MKDDTEDDNVGYCRPPKRHRFKKGKSGNKNGRPPKQKQSFSVALGRALEAALSGKISIKDEDGRVSRIECLEALARKICLQIMKKPDPRMLEAVSKIIEQGKNDLDLTDQPMKIIVEGAAEQILLHEMEIPRSEGERWIKRLNKKER